MQAVGRILLELQLYAMWYSLSWTFTVAVAPLGVSLVALVPNQLVQSIRERQVQLPILRLLLLLQKACSRRSPHNKPSDQRAKTSCPSVNLSDMSSSPSSPRAERLVVDKDTACRCRWGRAL
ncbi:hypothetical protein EYF80_019896 [Liparis tanakae]|uniref:Uncharacterized protein n=1 Tax=Liparis tanakae TaxID=230148 RepID=A0A4Z2HVX7_9TELE|nr:hypothetical protein EYF80_019896 [Liparis tanakae]